MACNEQGVLLLHEFDLIRREARECHRDAVVVFAGPLDVVGRPIWRGLNPGSLVEHIEQPVETNSRAIQGREVVGSHNHILLRATWEWSAGSAVPAPSAKPIWPWQPEKLGSLQRL